MQRRKAVTVAATTSLTLLAAAGGIGLSSGILSAAPDDGVGRISPVNAFGQPARTGAVDGRAGTALTTAPSPTSGQADQVTARTATACQSNDQAVQEKEHEEQQSEAHEYEGADDDD